MILAYICVTSLLLTWVYIRPYEMVRPSMMFAASMMVFLNVAAAFFTLKVDASFSRTPELRFLSIIFPLGVLAWGIFTPTLSNTAKSLVVRCKDTKIHSSTDGFALRITILLLGSASFFIMALYLSEVSIWNTGLSALFFESDSNRMYMARELSLKLVDNNFVRYSYSWHVAVLAPLQGILVLFTKPQHIASKIARILYLLALLISVSLTGAKFPPGYFFLLISLALFLRKQSVRALLGVFLAGVAILGFGIMIKIKLGGGWDNLSFQLFSSSLCSLAWERIIIIPFETGIQANSYMETFSLPLFSTIRPLAWIAGVDYVNLPNIVARELIVHGDTTMSNNTCFIYDFQAAFGLYVGWFVAVMCLVTLDFGLFVFERLGSIRLCAFLAAFLGSSYSLLSSAYSVSLVTHGILLSIVLGYGFSRLFPDHFIRASILPRHPRYQGTAKKMA